MTTAASTKIPARAWDAPLLRPLDAAGRAAVEAACVLHRVAQGAAVARAEDPADTVFVVVSGRVDVVRAGRSSRTCESGEVLGEEAVVAGAADRDADLVAGEASVVGLVPQTVLRRALARSGAGHLLGRTETGEEPTRPRHGAPDRKKAARSLLVLDAGACVSCGQCASACADTHDGVPRLARRGERVDHEAGGVRATLVLLESCHHCTHPSCLPACPTGAIVREPDGRVRIRESLCTGCEACTKACPWDNVRMTARGDAAVAAKCDLCEGAAPSPACVAACPVEALVRVDPAHLFDRAPGRALLGGPAVTVGARPVPTFAWPSAIGGVLVGLAVVAAAPGRTSSGVVVLALLALLLVGLVLRRTRRLRARLLHVAHLAVGATCAGAFFAHAAALSWFAACVITMLASGAVAAVAYALLPRRLAELSNGVVLVEDAEAQLAKAREEAFAHLSGRGASAKAVYAASIGPHAFACLGGVRTLAFGRAREAERARLRAVALALAGGRGHALDGLDELLDLAVGVRGTRAFVVGTRLLRGLVIVHVAASLVALVMIAVHVASVVGRR